MVEELLSLKEGIVAYDAFLFKEGLLVAPVLFITCDNPRASEITNNLGPGAKMFCRICMVMLCLATEKVQLLKFCHALGRQRSQSLHCE